MGDFLIALAALTLAVVFSVVITAVMLIVWFLFGSVELPDIEDLNSENKYDCNGK